MNKKYTQAYFDEALEKVRKNEMSYRDAENEYGVPIATLSDHKNGKYVSQKRGAKTILSVEEEQLLVTIILSLGDAGVGINKFEIRKIVQNYLNTTNHFSKFNKYTA
jgi:hypothetical protein